MTSLDWLLTHARDPLFDLRNLSLVVWFYALWRFEKPTRRAFTAQATTWDPVFAVLSGFALVFIIFGIRYLVFDGEPRTAPERFWLVFAYLLTLTLQYVVLRFASWSRSHAT